MPEVHPQPVADVERRFTPDLYSIVTAAKQTAGDQYALHVAETAREYPYAGDHGQELVKLGLDRARLPDGEIVGLVSRLPGPSDRVAIVAAQSPAGAP